MIAEDLGDITPEVAALVQKSGYPGMRVLQFGFLGEENSPHLPHNYDLNCVAYTGTHDNEPLADYLTAMPAVDRATFEKALEKQCLLADVPYIVESLEDECQSVVELLFSTIANTVIVPMHDVLGSGSEARITAPSTVTGGNWTFRYTEKDFKRRKAAWLKGLCEQYNR